MLFNTIDFVIFFILVVSVIVVVKNRKFQHLFLLFASYFFFYYSSNYLISLLVFSTVLDFYVGKKIWDVKDNLKKKKILLICSLAGNLGLLGFFKYADFAIAQFNFLGNFIDLGKEIPFLNLALPIGISFYTFQTISYTVDIYRGNLIPSKSFREFALFVTFFPQLVAGPILRAKEFLPQLREKIEQYSNATTNKVQSSRLAQIVVKPQNLKLGITIMAIGFFKKMFFADNIAPLANQIFSDPTGLESFSIILGAISFGIQIYADFSGYSDIAIGAATIFGFRIPQNFNKPYFASSPADFWHRWHISLSSWLRDYLYVPLGGNRISSGRTYVNLFTVMFLGGLWHGASWNFVIWGLLHGAYLTIQKIISNKISYTGRVFQNKFFKSRLWVVTSIFATQYLIFFAWIPFRVRNIDFMAYSMQKYVFLDFAINGTMEIISNNKISVALIVLFSILSFVSYKKNIVEFINKLGLLPWTVVMIVITSLILVLYNGHPETFIYFKF